MITSGIVKLYEGHTICYPENNGDLKVLATCSDNKPAILYADHEVLEKDCGRVVVDCGFTKLYLQWDAAGTARYIVNSCIWLLSLESKVMNDEELISRRKKEKREKMSNPENKLNDYYLTSNKP
eukprot:TRINITY_DN2516_c0_g1_i3.p1 TRINITY_DN2516_c0_g1~~TRINITY_DN2516_c0_g1_i3.p1  ORF type:complete len:124 (-),score=19.77 TRINITY_DN2516_c0_g1_i3:11-382(-)